MQSEYHQGPTTVSGQGGTKSPAFLNASSRVQWFCSSGPGLPRQLAPCQLSPAVAIRPANCHCFSATTVSSYSAIDEVMVLVVTKHLLCGKDCCISSSLATQPTSVSQIPTQSRHASKILVAHKKQRTSVSDFHARNATTLRLKRVNRGPDPCDNI